MEGMNKTDGQWIVMMGLLVSVGIFFLALVITQSTLVGQTTSEGVLEFPKADIQDIRNDVMESVRSMAVDNNCDTIESNIGAKLSKLAIERKSAIVSIECHEGPFLTDGDYGTYLICGQKWGMILVNITYNNGVTDYRESTCISAYGWDPEWDP
jgi:predicted RecA/RadA family phage recombinase